MSSSHKKLLLQAALMAAALFVYGYLLSSVGHDHASHQKDSNDSAKPSEDHEHHGHSHDHSH